MQTRTNGDFDIAKEKFFDPVEITEPSRLQGAGTSNKELFEAGHAKGSDPRLHIPITTNRSHAMQFMILAYEDDNAFESRDDPDRSGEYWASWGGYIAALTESGVLAGAGGLLPPSTATTLQVRDGARMLQDGPFADTKEQLGGYFVIEVDDLDAALEWAAVCPSAEYASVEVRPLMPASPAM